MSLLWRSHRSLAARVVLPFALCLVVVFGVLTFCLGQAVRHEGLRELHERQRAVAEILAHNAELPLLAGDSRSMTLLLESAGGVNLIEAVILDREGRAVVRHAPPSSTREGRLDEPSGASLVIESAIYTQDDSGDGKESALFVLDHESVGPKDRIGTVRLLVSTQKTLARTRRLQAGIAFAGAGLLAVCIGIGVGVAKVIVGPLKELVAGTRRVAAGDLSARVVPSSTDEVGRLGEAFNSMAADLEAARAQLTADRAQLDRAREQLFQAEKLTALGQLVAGVAHEINNPLASVIGYTQLALRREVASDVRRRLEIVCSEAERAARIVSNLLTFARKQPPEKRYIGLNGIIKKTLELREYNLRTSQIHLETCLQPDLPKTMLDFHQVQQVLINLLNNAEQALLESGQGGSIRIETRRMGDLIEARVTDDGPGVPSEIRARIFEPFFTTKEVGKGTGLGLSLCSSILQEHGGSLRVESIAGRGATFILELPILNEGAASGKGSQPASTTVPECLRILLVDDEPSFLDLLVDLLVSRGHKVDTASDVPEALGKLAGGHYDVVVTDMRMPHGSGRDIHAAVAVTSPQLAQRFVFLTGDTSSREAQHLAAETSNPILAKPCRVEDIEQAIAQVIGEQASAAGRS